MGKKVRKLSPEMDFDDFDDFDDHDLARDIFSTDWDHYSEEKYPADARRKIERRRDMKKLYSQLNEWEEFGEKESDYIY